MKKILPLALMCAISFALSGQTLTLVGNYSEHIISMCSQGCEFYEIGPFRLTQSLNISQDAEESVGFGIAASIPVLVVGELKTVNELPTIAGPKASNKKAGKAVLVERFVVESYKQVNLVDISILEEEYTHFEKNEDYKLQFSVTNPTEETLKLKLHIQDGDFVHFKIEPGETTEVEYPVIHDGYTASVKLQIMEHGVDEDEVYHSVYTKSASSGLMFFIEEYISVSNLERN